MALFGTVIVTHFDLNAGSARGKEEKEIFMSWDMSLWDLKRKVS